LKKRCYMRKSLPVAVVLFCAGLILLMWANTSSPDANAERMKFIRESPAWLFYGFMTLASAPVFATLWILINQKRWSRIATSGSVQNAKKMALSLWRVASEPMNSGVKDDWAVVKFQHFSFGNWTVIVPVRPGHPDIDKFQNLRKGETVEFEALSKGMDCALENEICGFLRIKSIS